MAKKTIEKFYSDLSKTEIDDHSPTLEFSYDGAAYEIDLTASEKADFEQAIDAYVRAARRLSGTKRPRGRTGSRHDPKVVRAWAKENGHEVPGRGRIPASILEAYEKAH